MTMQVEITHARSGTPLPLSPSGVLLTQEGATAHVAVTTLGNTNVTVQLEGIPLVLLSAVAQPERRLCRTFELPIHTWAGRAVLVCQTDEKKLGFTLDVSPHPGKFGSTQLTEYLEELMRRAAGLPFGFSPGSHDFELADEGTRLLHPFVIEALLPPLLEALGRLRQDALQSTVRKRRMAPLTTARRVDARTLRWLASHPVTYAAVRPMSARREDGNSRTDLLDG